MAPIAPVKLGPYTDIRPVIVQSITDVSRDGANPYAAPSGGNAGYNDLEGWAEWTMSDWQAGAGMKDPEAGGFLFSTADTRVPRQVILPQMPLLTQADAIFHDINSVFSYESLDTVTVTTSGSIRKYGYAPFSPAGNYGPQGLSIPNLVGSTVYALISGAAGTVITAEVFDAPSGVPTGAALASGTATLTNPTPSPRWEAVTLSSGAGTWDSATTGFPYLCVAFSANATITMYEASSAGDDGKTYNGSAWSSVPNGRPMIWDNAFFFSNGSAGGTVTHIAEFNGTVYAIANKCLYKWSAGDLWTVITSALPQTASDLVAFNDVLYIGQSSGNFRTCSTGDVVADGGSVGQKFARHSGLLYKAASNDIYYSADGSSWTSVLNVTPSNVAIAAMAGMGQNLYFATNEGLYYLAPGDFAVGIMPWHTSGNNTIVRMTEWQGDIYVLSNNIIYRLDASHTLLPLHVPSDDENLDGYGRTIYSIAPSQAYLYVGTHGGSGGMIWAWSPEGWHTVAILPAIPYALRFSRLHSYMWVGTVSNAWAFRQVDTTLNPALDSGSIFHPFGWLETDKFHGTVVRLLKDYESVFVDGDNISNVQTIKVYYKFEGDTSWSLLGTHDTGDNTELRWNTNATREGSHSIRLGFLLYTNDHDTTPILEVASLKYVPMVNDRYRWRLAIMVPPAMFDDDDELFTTTYTQSSMITHLDACIKSVVPIIYEDVDGTQYEVKVISHSRSVERYTRKKDGNKELTYIYFLTIEQIQKNPYVAG